MRSQPEDQGRDPRLPNKPLKTYSGSFESFRLDFTPWEPPPPESRQATFITHYTYAMGNLHILLDGEDAAELVPSGWLFGILTELSSGLSKIVAGQAITVHWGSDPWQMDIKSNPKRNRAFITLYSPGNNWVAMRDVSVPLDQLAREVLSVSKRWLLYLDGPYHDEIQEMGRGKSYRNSKLILKEQERALRQYEMA